MLQIPPNARTTPVTRAEIAGSHERTGVLAQRYGVSTVTAQPGCSTDPLRRTVRMAS
jgi:hypothetical protein